MKKLIVIPCFLGLFSCATTITPTDFTKLNEERPKSILILPPLNNSTNVNAAEYFISTLAPPFSNRGYYTFPSYMVMKTLADNGLSDTSIIYNTETTRLSNLFNCDAALYVKINTWNTIYVVLAAKTQVSFDYELKSCKTNEILWKSSKTLTYTPSNNSTGNALADLAVAAISAAAQKAAPNYIPLANQANFEVTSIGPNAIPSGPYGLEVPKN